MSTTTVRAGRRTVEVHRPEKVLFPADGFTKADLVDYHRAIAPHMLPHLRGRPLMLERLPDGLGGPGFMQKDTPESFPDWVRRAEVPKEGGTVTHTVCGDTATLVYLADQACVTLHRWQSRTDRPHHPDRMVFDLDPPEDDFEPVRRAARLLGDLLAELRLPSALMTTGSRGLHVIVPLGRRHAFDEVRAFAKDAADLLAASHPDRLTTEARKAARGDRLYLDVLRNGYAQTAVAPYSVRAREGAPVATPVSWDQLDDPDVTARRWNITNVLDQAAANPWEEVPRRGRALGPARRRLDALRRDAAASRAAG
ncbi:non-homologous end-joining DNA ligase [Streptomyces tirandamycinicus]|uniref:non-homologous end-joining DNA ligase n=1 Tax=Streptomyces tirandamycinicus TaxID=2174846 RepID=UPI0022709569|nr:non-homologous end-joining DNA ligase [Streptomyces tirandamycinicus]MCY0982140.1 non-homologous end-joining DNA ligase [Streptomyces tirandamycinicus]